MACKYNSTISCNNESCEGCRYAEGIQQTANDNAVKGFTFLDENGNPVSGLHLVESKKV